MDALRRRNEAMCEMEIYSNYNFDMCQQYVSTEVDCMRESDEGSTLRDHGPLGVAVSLLRMEHDIYIIQESEIARQRYRSELENAVRHIQEQHHDAEESETAEQFRQQRERLHQECTITLPRRRR